MLIFTMKANGCSKTFQDFYSEINRKELYLRYVYKLSELHLACDNYTEAGYTLRQHADLLRWSPDPLSNALRSPHYTTIDRHDELKEKLYEEIIGFFDKGKVRIFQLLYFCIDVDIFFLSFCIQILLSLRIT